MKLASMLLEQELHLWVLSVRDSSVFKLMIGFPSVGKSTLMSELTGTHSEVAAYECTLTKFLC